MVGMIKRFAGSSILDFMALLVAFVDMTKPRLKNFVNFMPVHLGAFLCGVTPWRTMGPAT